MNKTSSLRADTATPIKTCSRAKVAANDAQFGSHLDTRGTFGVAPLAFRGARVRTDTDADGAVWFAAVDIARVLGFKHTPHMVRLLDDDEAAVRKVDIRSKNGVVQSRDITLINE